MSDQSKLSELSDAWLSTLSNNWRRMVPLLTRRLEGLEARLSSESDAQARTQIEADLMRAREDVGRAEAFLAEVDRRLAARNG